MSIEEYNNLNGTWHYIDAAEILEKSGREILSVAIRDIRTDINAALLEKTVKDVATGRIYEEISYIFYGGEWLSGWYSFTLFNIKAWMVNTNLPNFNLSGGSINS